MLFQRRFFMATGTIIRHVKKRGCFDISPYFRVPLAPDLPVQTTLATNTANVDRIVVPPEEPHRTRSRVVLCEIRTAPVSTHSGKHARLDAQL